MSKQKLTPWFPPSVKPVWHGLYETEDSDLNGMRHYNLWDGERWYYGNSDLDASGWDMEEWPKNAKSLARWRGLAKEPQ